MPFQLQIDDAQPHIWYSLFSSPLSWEEYDRGIDELAKRIYKVQTPVYIIMQITATLPSGNVLPHLRQTKQRLGNDNLRLCIIVAEPPSWLFRFLQNLVTMFGLESTQFPRVNTLPEAYTLITTDQARHLPA